MVSVFPSLLIRKRQGKRAKILRNDKEIAFSLGSQPFYDLALMEQTHT